jgi:hypothetical protein
MSAARAWLTPGSPQRVAKLGFNRAEVGIEHVRPGDDDDIQARGNLRVPEHFANQALGPVPDDGATQFPGGRDPEAAPAVRIGARKDGHQPCPNPHAVFIDLQELRAAADASRGGKRMA